MKLYVVRHGETEYNKEYKVCGISDIPLTEKGRMQAEQTAIKVRNTKIDRVFVSPLLRARQTADILLNGTGLNYEIEPLLTEENFGKSEGVDRNDPVFQHAKKNMGVHQPEGESFLGLVHRAYTLIEKLDKNYPDENILLVCHGTLGRAIRTYFVDMTNDEIYGYQMENCELIEYKK